MCIRDSGTIGSSNDQDSAVHLSSTGDHVLNVVSMARAVNVSVVALLGLVLNVSGVDRDTTSTLLRSLIDVSVVHELCKMCIRDSACSRCLRAGKVTRAV